MPKTLAAAPHNGHCRLDRFGHNFAQLTRVGVLTFARNDCRFDREQARHQPRSRPARLPARPDRYLRPCRSGIDARRGTFPCFSRDRDAAVARFQQQRLNDLATNLRDLALEVSNARFTRVMLNDVAHCALGNLQLLFLEAVFLQLLRNQVTHRDIELLVLGVTREYG